MLPLPLVFSPDTDRVGKDKKRPWPDCSDGQGYLAHAWGPSRLSPAPHAWA